MPVTVQLTSAAANPNPDTLITNGMAAKSGSHIQTLPPELLSEVFALVRDQQDITRCRLVCREFHRLSSPFLLKRVVLAQRPDVLQKFCEVVEHPYFSKHVTDLLWDASLYTRDIASSFETYRQHWIEAPRTWSISPYDQAYQEDMAWCESLSQYQPRAGAESVPSDQASRLQSNDDSAIEGAALDDESNHLLAAMVHQSYANYHRLRTRQELCRDTATSYLRIAFEGLPKLRNVTCADYRALSRCGENYEGLCARLFGQTLNPKPPPHDRYFGLDYFFNELCQVGPKLKSLRIGHNNFDTPEFEVIFEPPLERSVPNMRFDEVYMFYKHKSFKPLLAFCDSVHLFVDFGHATIINTDGAKETNTALTKISSTLKELALVTAPTARRIHVLADPTRDRYGQYERFAEMLDRITFPNLRTLELRGFQLDFTTLEDFILAHRSTLRELHLINNFCANFYTDCLTACAQKWSKELPQLRGVEIVDLCFTAYDAAAQMKLAALPRDENGDRPRALKEVGGEDECHKARFHRCDVRHWSLEIQAHDRWRGPANLDEPQAIKTCPKERTEFEQAIMGGRENLISRRARRTKAEDHCRGLKWYQIPVYPP